MHYQDRIRLDRYAAKDPDAELKRGVLVVAATQFVSKFSGKIKDSREVGTIESVDQQNGVQLYKVRVGNEVIENQPRDKLEYIVEKSYQDICWRMSTAAIENEPNNFEFRDAIFEALVNEEFVPAGRIQTGLGVKGQGVTLFNCLIFQIDEDSRGGITRHWGRLFDTFSRG